MNTQKRIQQIVTSDVTLDSTANFTAACKTKDHNHLQRRQQQRGISDCMIQIALKYGKRYFNRGAILFVLGDRDLQNTPYAKLSDRLRGLTVVCQASVPTEVLTTYWHQAIRRRVRR